jgi:hydroxyacylglutathione hydrolase
MINSTFQIKAVPALKDNYIWLIIHRNSNQCLIIDPGDAKPVIDTIEHLKLNPIAVLLTHHHYDHSQGAMALKTKYNLNVYGSAIEGVASVNHPLFAETTLNFFPESTAATVLKIPGHTRDHLAYLFEHHLFCGDTLFTSGCGRIFEGTADQLLNSLKKIMALPDNTLIYCGHEYTIANLKFAKTVDPDNERLLIRIEDTRCLRDNNLPSVPATLLLEKQTNPFLRCDTDAIKTAVENHFGQQLDNELQVFTALRKWKDLF